MFLWLNSTWMPILRSRIQFHIAALSTVFDSRDYMKQGYTWYIVTIVLTSSFYYARFNFFSGIDISTPSCVHTRGSDFVYQNIEISFSPYHIHRYQQLVVDTDTVPTNIFFICRDSLCE